MESINTWKFNTRVKVYPDGNYVSTTANRPHFLNADQRLFLKLQREMERERSEEIRRNSIANYKAAEDVLYGGGEYYREFMESAGFEARPVGCGVDEAQECNEILQSVFKKARKLGIPLNGVVWMPEKKNVVGNIRRARDKIFDLIYLNEFQYFATFTFNPKKTDSFDVEEVMQKVVQWLKNHQKRNGLKYVMVPEHHKSGRIHLHMLYSGDLKLKSSGKWTKQGKPIYNCTSWRYGFSTVIPCDQNRAKLAFYVSKYVTKDVKKIFGKYYYSSQGLKRDCPIEYTDRVFSDIQGDSVYVESIDIRFKYESSIKFNSMSFAEENSAAILRELGLEAVE